MPQTTLWMCEFEGCCEGHEGADLPEGWSQFGESLLTNSLAVYCPTHSSLDALLDNFVAKHCTQSDDHDYENCKKCLQMKTELVDIVNGWLKVIRG
jgi:hypothetical protein